MEFLSKIVCVVDYINITIGKLSKYLIIVLVGSMLIEIFLRYGLKQPTQWSIEWTVYVFGTYFFMNGGYVLLRDSHVRMDIFYSKWSKKGKLIADIATFPFLAIYLAVFVYGGIGNIQYALKFDQHSRTLWGPPLAPIKTIITIGALLLLIQGIADLIRNILLYIKEDHELIKCGHENHENKEKKS